MIQPLVFFQMANDSGPLRHCLSGNEKKRKVEELRKVVRRCRLCPRECGVLRLDGHVGPCGAAANATVAHFGPHFGEEPAFTCEKGAGNIFFEGCNLQCVFCQNHQISHPGSHRTTVHNREKLVMAHLELERMGCQNIQWVTASHVLHDALEALFEADELGFGLPLVYNSSGYEKVDTLKALKGVVDVYLPDFKFGPDAVKAKPAVARNYFDVAAAALEEMVRQVGHLELDETGAALRGVVVRHLVLPGDLADTSGVLQFLADRFGPAIWISLMSQYNPRSPDLPPPLNRPLTRTEYERAVETLERLGFSLGWVQSIESRDSFNPDFDLDDPFERAC